MDHHSALRSAFGISQIVFFAAVFVGVVVYWIRNRDRARRDDYRLDALDIHATVHRTPVPPVTTATKPAPTAAIDSGLPSWNSATSAHEVLGLPLNANARAIEKAYRALLKRYHPDRFAHWGAGYQTRAHHVVLLLQKARDEMLAALAKR